ncbi:MAG: protein kinase, partial [Phycisphaerales bacterium]
MSEDKEKKSDKPKGQDKASSPTLGNIGPAVQLGTQIGHYKLLGVLGEGGCGIVYRAEQKQPVRRQVALKVIKPGMDSKQVVARFESERQALALLDHPNIAHVFDGGTTEGGRPYFAMELVKGLSITEYCDEHKLGIEERLRLFHQVCEAVQYAHQKGIIHRDIKPSNILVRVRGGKPVPMIIDFGVAKAISQPLTERTLFTEQGQFIGTPEYMSPEQAGMTIEDVDTRSDIYSLGVVLYELLIGTLPFSHDELGRAGFAEIQRIIRETDPPHPSTRLSSLGDEAKKVAARRHTEVAALTRRLHKELEWIPLKAMRKEPERRYKTASEFADDVRNYLNGDPLVAGPESLTYRASKFARKHTGPIASATAILLVLVVGLAVSMTMYIAADKAHKEEAIARAEADRLRAEEAIQRQRAEAERDKSRESRLLAEQRRNEAVAARKEAEQQRKNAEAVANFLKSANKLDLSDHSTSDMDLAHIAGSDSLRSLYVSNTQISDEDLAHVKDLTALEALYLGRTRITNSGMANLKNLSGLQRLCVHRTQVGDAGLEYVKDLTSLEYLCLNDTKVTNAGLVHLTGLTSLQHLNLEGTQVTEPEISKLNRVLPDCHIVGTGAPEEGKQLAFDDFDGKLSLDWTVLHSDPSHYSLIKNPGHLTITTQKGSFHRSIANFKNLFLIDNPVEDGGDFHITTCIVAFAPMADYHQAGLVCFDDEDNYIKWTYEWNGAQRQRVFALIRETQGSVRPHMYVLNIPKSERVWFRLSKSGNRYKYSTSTDGKSFHVHGNLPWGTGAPKSLGLVAANDDYPAPEIDAAFDFFEVRAAHVTYVIPEQNLQIPQNLQACAENLQIIYTAIKRHEKDEGELPNWLSDLVPNYLSKEVLLCPSSPSRVTAQYYPDPNLPSGYSYEFSPAPAPPAWNPTGKMICRDWKKQQLREFGDVLPIVRCFCHGSSKVLNMSVGGQIWWGPLNWEYMFKPDYRLGDESAGGQRREIQPAGQLRIVGVARDEAGKPLAGVKLQVLPMSRGEVTSDSQGRFEVGWTPRRLGSRQTVHYLVARLEERNLAVAVEINEETKTLDVKLKPGVILTGKVVDPEGKGIAGARIMTVLWGSTWGSSLRGGDVQTDAEGRFEVTAIPPEHRYSVAASAEGYGRSRVEIRADDAVDDQVEVGQLTLAVANLSVSGVVVGADDEPVADARVYCSGEGQPGHSTQTDAEGKFTLEKICAGRIRVTASVSGTTRLYGYIETDGGASDIKLVVSERPSATRYIPKQTPSLVGRPLPDLKDLRIDLSPTDTDNKMVLICFWDMEQRPSRYCMRELTKRAEELKGKGVIVVGVQSSVVNENALNEWLEENNTPFPVGMIRQDVERVRFTWGVKAL